jgi:diguanylate cyclase (GGDEF)-like protein
MSLFNKIGNLPIQKKLWLFNLLTALIAGICSAFLLIVIVWNVEHRNADHAANIKAAIIAENALPALRFHDVKTAEEILAGLGRDTEILGARIIEPGGHIFASFVPGHANSEGRSTQVGMMVFRVSAAMAADGEHLATLELDSDRGYVVGQILTYVGAVTLSMLLALLVGSFVGVRLQRAITHPLSALAALMKDVSAGGNLSQRATIIHRDELGELSESFNRMIEQIEQRNTALGEELAERRNAETRLEHLALHDQVTGLPNRHFFRKRTADLMRSTAAGDSSRALLFVDLDNFKYVNDTFGHDCGDQLLIVVAERLSASVRAHDMVVRFGGDEFVVLLEHVRDLAQAQRRANELLEAVTQPFKLADRDFFITCSIGVAMAPDHSENFDELLQKADAAMYVAKNAGKNGVRLWEPSFSKASTTRYELEADLHQALEKGELEMHYQPIINLLTGHIAGMEALMRWHHPARGFVSPSEFIPVAEDCGLILILGEWAMHTAFAQAKQWNERFGPLFVAVNVSGIQFRDREFASKAEAIARASGLARDMCELEVTESVVMGHSGEAVRILDELSTYGFSLSLDDFGTGYSSLSYLKRFSLDKLKIDRSFITDLPDDVEDVAITEAIVGLAKILSMRIVAEGIESGAQAAMLRTLGCQYGQGYYFSKPLPVERMSAFISKNHALVAHQPEKIHAVASL